MREPRLGDVIDDFCVKCKRVMNHSVVSLLNGEPAKVRCRTCHSDHDYRHEQAPPPKVDLRKQALFNEVLHKVDPDAPLEMPVDEVDVEAEAIDDAEVAAVAEAEPPPPVVKPKKKAKGKG